MMQAESLQLVIISSADSFVRSRRVLTYASPFGRDTWDHSAVC